MHTTIKTLFEKGYTKSDIARILRIDRKTVSTVLSKLEEVGVVERKSRSSILDEYKEFIQIQVNKRLSAKRIYQDLVSMDNQYSGSYDSVKRYVASIKTNKQKPYMVLHSLPGEEAQVDFGYIGTIRLKNGKYKKAWIFVMELSYSRYMYVKIVFDQSVSTFIDCHKKAFKFFMGVPETVKIDNLKAGILEADFYEPVVQRNYSAFATHYGFMAEPCRVYTPTDKGKVESNVKYVKNNCFKGRDFVDIEDAESFLNKWLDTIANVRVHGTTKKVPNEEFISVEKSKLNSLPINEFTISDSAKCVVQTNCHISYKGNYYSVPHEYIGDSVDLSIQDNLLKIFHKGKEVALHQLEKIEKGKHITNKNHYPEYKNISAEAIKSRYAVQMSQIGTHAKIFFDKFLENTGNKYNYRTVTGILSLRKKYSNETIDNACHRAYSYNALKYKYVKTICEKGLMTLPVESNESYTNESETDISRSLKEYMKYLQ
jgi:transposase